MQLKANKFAHKIFICCNVIIILLSLLIYLIILPQFDNYISKEKESSLRQLNQMLSEKSKMCLDYSDEYADGYQGSTMYNTVSNIVNTEILRYFQINPDFVYYALIPKREAQSIKPLLYNTEKIQLIQQ